MYKVKSSKHCSKIYKKKKEKKLRLINIITNYLVVGA